MNIAFFLNVAIFVISIAVVSGQNREEMSAIGNLRAIISAEMTFSALCGGGGYAISLEDLARPERRTGERFVASDLAEGRPRGTYTFTIVRGARQNVTDVSTAAATCNGSKGNPASSFFASAAPITPSTGDRFFAVDERGLIYFSSKPIPNPIVESAAVVRYQ
jgi:hypothetical protein